MFTSAFGAIKGLFDNAFIVAFWAPVFLLAVVSTAVVGIDLGPAQIAESWDDATATIKWVLVVGTFTIVTVLAYVLQALSDAVLAFYAGYAFPTTGDLDLTRLGKKLDVSRTRIESVFGLDPALWWPRLDPLIGDELRSALTSKAASLTALLNLTTFLGIAGAGGAIYLIAYGDSVVLFLAVVLALPGIAYACYLAAIQQGEAYGELIAVAFDLHRHDLLEKLGVEVPSDYDKEVHLWKRALTPWFKEGHRPYDHAERLGGRNRMSRWLRKPFYYDLREGPASPPAPAPPVEHRVQVDVSEVRVSVDASGDDA